MATYREIVYMVLDELKINSDDKYFEEEHVMFLMDKYRAFLLKQRYSDIKKQMPESNLQTICLDLIEVPAISGIPCEGGSYLRSQVKIPFMMQMAQPSLYPQDYYQGINISYISRDRMRFVGENKYLKNIIYSSLGPDSYLYFKSSNPQFLYLQKVKMTGVFENPQDAAALACNADGQAPCDVKDAVFPIEEALVPPLIELIVRELLPAVYRPEDKENDTSDNLGELSVKK